MNTQTQSFAKLCSNLNLASQDYGVCWSRGFLTSALALTVMLALANPAWGQGTVNFNTSPVGARVLESVGFPGAGLGLGNTANGVASGTQFLMQLFAAAGNVTDSSQLVPVGVPVNSRNGTVNNGYSQVSGTTTLGASVDPTVSIPFLSPGGPVTVQLRAWWAGPSGTTYTTLGVALGSSDPQMRWGASPLLHLASTGNATTPVDLVQLQGFQLNPWFDLTPPLISVFPQSPVNIAPGSNTTLNAIVFGAYPVGYQWRKDTVTINNATQANYTITAATYADTGAYDVVVTNYYGSSTSYVAQVTVVKPPTITLELVGGFAGLVLDGVPGFTYPIQYSTNLTDNAWILATNYPLTLPIETWVDTSVEVHSPTSKERFYRVLAP